MSDESVPAPGPIDAGKHIDENHPREDRPVDERAAALDAARKMADTRTAPAFPAPDPGPIPMEYDNPAGAVIVQELQDIRAQLSLTGTAVLTGVWLVGMTLGFIAFTYYRNNPPVPTTPPTEVIDNGE